MADKNFKFSPEKSLDVLFTEISTIENETQLADYFSSINYSDPQCQSLIPLINKIISEKAKSIKEVHTLKGYLSAIQDSPYLPKSIEKLYFQGIIDRKWVLENEYGKRIDEKHGTAYIFKERAKNFANIIGLDGDSIRLALNEAIHNIFEYGFGDYTEIEIKIENINQDDAFIELCFKHDVPKDKFYSLDDANKNADEGIINFENDRGRGEFMMRELMDERRFLNGTEIDEKGNKKYFFKRVMRKYKNTDYIGPKPLLMNEIRTYIDKIVDYKVTMFMEIDFKTHSFHFVFITNKPDFEKVKKFLLDNQYTFKEQIEYKNFVSSAWDTKKEINQTSVNEILKELESLS